jgi:sensor c-di-GMP phosphodiesterase-like protein
MRMKRRRQLILTVLAVLGTFFGMACSLTLARILVQRAAVAGLADYANDLSTRSELYAAEVDWAWKSFQSTSSYPFCSPQEITAMQAAVFGSLQIKDIALSRDGMLYCSAVAGRLATPFPVTKTFLLLPNGAKLYQGSPLAVPGTRGVVIEQGDVNILMSPTAFDYWSRPHTGYAVFLTNSGTGQSMQIAGRKLPADPALVFAHPELRSSGLIYRTACNPVDRICAATFEKVSDISSGVEPLQLGFAGMGALAGLSLSFAIGQFYLRSVGLAQQLRRAIRKEAVALVYQPILELPSRRLVGAEALVRWSDEDKTPVPPDHFVRIAEERGFLGELTAMVIRKITRELGALLLQHPDFTLSVNVAASDLAGGELFVLLEEHVRKAGILPEQVVLELTERSTTDLAAVSFAVQRLHKRGYKVHIDDFGTGFSSLFYLHELDVDAIKIDRAFIRTLGTDAITASILPQILSIAESLNLDVIVEGVETESQANYLESTGRPMRAQGWFFGYPVAAGTLAGLMEPKTDQPYAQTSGQLL